MTKKQRKEIEELITKNPDLFTLRMLSDIFWCAKHEEELRKMMGLLPCGSEERYRIQNLFLMEGQVSLYFALRYSNLYGKTEEELAEEEKRIECYMKEQTLENKQPYDYDLEFRYQEETFLEWCDDYDCVVLVRKNKDYDLLRLSYIALAVGYKELAAYICTCINPDGLTDSGNEQNKVPLKSMEEKWIQDFIDKQPEGEKKEELKKNIETNWPALKASKFDS